jgi:Holliday junction resolvasome RuvABC endonuclease subunit
MKVLSFDPSMAHTAAVLIDFTGTTAEEMVKSCWEYPSPDLLSGNLGYLNAYPALAEAVAGVINTYAPMIDIVVHEMPPPSGHLARPESALLASAAIRHQASLNHLPVVGIDPRHAKKVVTGNPNATKPAIRLWFAANLPSWVLTNEHKRDAALVAIAWFVEQTGSSVDQWLSSIAG